MKANVRAIHTKFAALLQTLRVSTIVKTLSAPNSAQHILGVTDLALTCGSEPVVDAVCTAVVGSLRTGLVLDAGSDREDRSSDVCFIGDTRKPFSKKKMMTASCTLISAEQHERLLDT